MISSSSHKSSPAKLVSTTKKTSPTKQKDESDSPAFRKMRERFFTEAVAEALSVKVNLRKSNDMEQVYATRIGGIYFDFIRTSDSFFFKFGSGFYRAGLNIKNNPHAKDPTWQKLFEFVEADSTKYRKYEKDKFVCGVGVVDLDTKEEDFISHLVFATTHNDLLFFTDKGKAYQIKMYDIPEGKRATKGKSVMNFLSLSDGEKITSILPMPKNKKEADGLALMMVTKNGTGKKSSATHFKDVRRSGLIAITLEAGDELMSVSFVSKNEEVMIATKEGQSIHFEESDVREMGRNAAGVRVIKLGKGDEVISADVVSKDAKNPALFVMGANGYGKKTDLSEYKVQNRGGSGILTMNVTAKTGPLMAAKVVTDDVEEIVAMSKKSQVIRVDLKEIPTLSRATQGVRVMKLREGDSLASLICL